MPLPDGALPEAKIIGRLKTYCSQTTIEPEVPAGCEDLERVLIGEDVSERLDVTAANFRVIVTCRPKYA